MTDKLNQSKEMSELGGTNFLVSIYRQENHSWQGSIQWLDTGVVIHFRSELELMHLINDAVRKNFEEGSSLRSWDEGSSIKDQA
jgi:hypothetical protein